MVEMAKTKPCLWCKREFRLEELSNRGFCYDCAIERMIRWRELQKEAHDKFMDEEIARISKRIDNSNLDKLFGDREKP